MPMFVLISGMLSKTELTTENIRKYISTLIIPFIVFEIFYEGFHYLVWKDVSRYTSNLQPYWILWFLFSLFIWRISLCVIANFRFPIVISILVSIIASYFENTGYYLGISRTFYFFPFYVIGHYLTSNYFITLKNRISSKLIFFLILIGAICFFSYFHSMNHKWLYGSYSLPAIGQSDWYAGIIRLALYIISLVVGISFISVLPDKKIIITSLGQRALFVYLWHGFFVKIIVLFGVINIVGRLQVSLTIGSMVILSLGIIFILSLKAVADVTEKYIFRPVRLIIFTNKS
jgi:fucose 4-O-acetylase-like acetyltransferase